MVVSQTGRFKNSKLLRLCLVFISILIAITFFEIAIHLISPDINLNYNWCYHPTLGWTQVPNSKYEHTVSGRKIKIEFNSKGFRDVEHMYAKKPNVRRIVIIGDSFSEAAQVQFAETYFNQLETKLSQHEKWEVINLGVGDFGTAQQWIALNEFGFKYSPDIVLHQIFPLNDICNNQIELFDLCKSNNDFLRPYFVEKNGQLQLETTQPVRNYLRKKFISYRLTEIFWHRFLVRNPQENEKRRQILLKEQNFGNIEPLLNTYSSEIHQIPEIVRGWAITEKILAKIMNECRQKNVKYAAMIVPFSVTINQPTWEQFDSVLKPQHLIRDYPDRRLQNFFDRSGVPSLALIDTFDGLHPDTPFLQGHFSAQGHSIAAEAIYQKLSEVDFLK
jgi:hypothetical protein